MIYLLFLYRNNQRDIIVHVSLSNQIQTMISMVVSFSKMGTMVDHKIN